MIVRILSFFSLLLLISCDDDNPYPTEDQWKTGMDTVRFDKTVIGDRKKYVELKNFLEKNADTILSISNQYEYRVTSYESGLESATRFVPRGIPAFLEPTFNSIINKIPHLLSFKFDQNKHVYFKVKEHLGLLNFDHYLYWNPIIEGDNMDERFKDTRLDSTCKYRIVAWWYEGR